MNLSVPRSCPVGERNVFGMVDAIVAVFRFSIRIAHAMVGFFRDFATVRPEAAQGIQLIVQKPPQKSFDLSN